MIYNLDNPWEIQQIKEYLAALIKKGGMVELKRKAPQRSLAQNRYLFLCLGYFASEFGYSVDEVKQDIFKRKVNPEIFIRERENRRGDVVKYLRSSADLTSAEMTTAIERFRNYSSAVAGLYIPAPNEKQFLQYVEQELERYKEYA